MKMICTPLTAEAMSLLDVDACPDNLLELLFLTDTEYLQLLKSGVFEKINAGLEKIIDDYEDEHIDTAEELSHMLKILEDQPTSENSELLKKLIYLNKLAIDKNTGVFFYF